MNARAAHSNDTWTCGVWRKLNTGDADGHDVVFNPAGGAIPVSIAMVDNSGGTHNGAAGPWTLEFAQQHEHPERAQPDGVARLP